MPKFTIKSKGMSFDLKYFSQPNQIICYADIHCLIWLNFSYGILGDISEEKVDAARLSHERPTTEW